jgi:hypothetical protein
MSSYQTSKRGGLKRTGNKGKSKKGGEMQMLCYETANSVYDPKYY